MSLPDIVNALPSGTIARGYLRIEPMIAELDRALEKLKKFREAVTVPEDALRMVGEEVLKIIDTHFTNKRGPGGPWKEYAPLTLAMGQRNPEVNTTNLLEKTGGLRRSFAVEQSGNTLKITNSRKSDGGVSLGAIHQAGAKIRVTSAVQSWFSTNFGMRLKVESLTLPERPMLYLSDEDRTRLMTMLTDQIAAALEGWGT